eukprot:SAG31_NODE_1225_length_9271_cov_10.376472_4_plen_168_part_00
MDQFPLNSEIRGAGGAALQPASMRAWNLVQCGYFVFLCPPGVFGALELELEVPDFVMSAPPSPPPNPGSPADTWSDGSAKRTLGGRLRTYVEEFIPEGIAASLAPSPPAQDVPQETQVADDGEGCVDKIGIASNATSPLYQCAYDRRKCYTYDLSREGYCADFVRCS